MLNLAYINCSYTAMHKHILESQQPKLILMIKSLIIMCCQDTVHNI